MSDQNTDVGLSPNRGRDEAAFRIYLKIFTFWQLSDIEASSLLGLVDGEWQKIKEAGSLPPHVLGRLSHILWIARLSTDLYPLDKVLSVSWLRKNNFEEPFLGMSPLYFMLSNSEEPLARTHRFLSDKFVKWGALRDERNKLVYLNDELRVSDEPLDTLVCMVFRVTRSWQLIAQEERSLIGIEISLEHSSSDQLEIRAETVEKLRMIVLIDLILWHIFHDQKKVTAWVRGKNTHPLFDANPPLHLLCSGSVGVMKVVYAYLRNISP